MAAVFLSPLAFEPTIQSSNAIATAPASRVLLDEPGLVARATGTLTITFATGSQAFDGIAAIRNSLAAAHTIRVRIGSDATMASGVLFDQTFPAWSGLPPIDKAISYIPLPQTFTAPYVTVDLIGSTFTNVEVSRILIGKRIEIDGVDGGAQFSYASASTITDGEGWTTVGEQRSRISWEANAGNVTRDSIYLDWSPFLDRVGKHAGFLFIPQTASDAIQRQAALVRFKDDATVVDVSSNRFRVEMTLFEV